MKLLVGLGNPGYRYADTRHNIGFMVIDEIARQFPGQPIVSDSMLKLSQTTIDQSRALLLQPQTYMNLSGLAVQSVAREYDIAPQDIAVAYDDLDLDVGRLRIRKTGGHGGHKGVRSLLEHLESPDFVRLRVGIGRPHPTVTEPGAEPRQNIVEYVLCPFTDDELPIIRETVKHAADALRLIAAGQIDTAMNIHNRVLLLKEDLSKS
jgi:PTH1 family peptidyl-tRNA hydrolase